MDLVTLIAACSLATSTTTQTTLYQISQTVEASPTYIDDLTTASVYDPATAAEAVGITEALVEAGHDIRVGLGQLPARQILQQYQISAKTLLDPCTNISLASDRMSVARGRYPDRPRRALSWYFTDDPADELGLAWAGRVLAATAVDVDAVAGRPDQAPPSPRFGEPSGRLFVAEAHESSAHRLDRSDASGLAPRGFTPGNHKQDRPRKWTPVSSSQNEEETDAPNHSERNPATHSQLPPATSRPSAAKKKGRGRVDSSSPGRAQPNVTDERLPTTDELDGQEEPNR